MCRSRFINRLSKAQPVNNRGRAQVKIFIYQFQNCLVRNNPCSESIYGDRNRLCNANRIGNLNFALMSDSGSNKIFSHIPGRIRGASVNLCRIFPRKCSAAMSGESTICIYNNFTPRQSCVSLWASNYKTPCAISGDCP